MSEQKNHDLLDDVYIPGPNDWLGLVVMSHGIDRQPLSDTQKKEFLALITSNVIAETVHALTVDQDDLTDSVLVGFTVSGHDREDALSNALHPIFSAIQGSRRGEFEFKCMQFATVGELTNNGDELGLPLYDVTEDANLELQTIEYVSNLLSDIRMS